MMTKHLLASFSQQQFQKSCGSPILVILCILTLLIISSCSTSPVTNQQATHSNIHPIALDSAHMFDTKQGWAFGMNDQAQISSIVRTTDGGQNWQDMTPAGSQLRTPEAAFISPAVAWVVMPQDDTTTRIIATTNGGQTWQSSTIQASSITHVAFLDSQHGWLLSSTDNDLHFDLWRTVDGKTWQDIAHVTPFQAGDSQLTIAGLSFVNASTGWLVGSTITNAPWIYVTHDGGQSWQPQHLPAPTQIQAANPALQAPIFLDASHGFLAANGFTRNCVQIASVGAVYSTSDGGNTWQPGGLTPLIANPSFINPAQGWAVSSSGMAVTHDGGQIWEQLPPDTTWQSALNITSIQFVSETVGWASGRDQQKFPLLLKTTDGGHSWSVVKAQAFSADQPKLNNNATPQAAGSPSELALAAPTPFNLPTSLTVTPAVENIHMFGTQSGWGQTPGGKYEMSHILHTSDGGKTWLDVLPQDQQANKGYSGPELVVDFLNASTAWFALSQGKASVVSTFVYHTSNGGQSWQEATFPLNIPNSSLHVRQLAFSDLHHGWLLLTATQDQTNTESAFIFSTSDGGQHWTQVATTGTAGGAIPLQGDKAAMNFMDTQTGWLTIGDYSTISATAGLYKSSDGGHTWTRQNLPTFANPTKPTLMPLAPTFFSANDGILPIQYSNTSSTGIVLYDTHNAGASWQVASILPITIAGALDAAQVDFLDASHGWIIDGTTTTLYMTSDGGHTWSKHSGFQGLQSVNFASIRQGWAQDSNSCSLLLSTQDGGQSWNPYSYAITA